MSALGHISYKKRNDDGEMITVHLTPDEILARLGSFANEEDAENFARIWNLRFYDLSGCPVFEDEEDEADTWQEMRDMIPC